MGAITTIDYRGFSIELGKRAQKYTYRVLDPCDEHREITTARGFASLAGARAEGERAVDREVARRAA